MIHLTVPGLPPSLNNFYMTIMKRQEKKVIPIRTLTPDGRKYKNEAVAHLTTQHHTQLSELKKNCPYAVLIRFHINGMCSKGWPKTAKGRYKRFDVTNRVKVIEDVVSEVSDVDDSHNLVVVAQKVDAPDNLTEIWIWNMEEEATPFNDALFNL